ncbi:MAG: VacJ family lipoprotein [Deltaproteobacteria bacterium]|nr:VacJ family lipoprotein [Deltaproteobacteria bacterium]
MKFSASAAILLFLVFAGCAHSPNQGGSISPSGSLHPSQPALTAPESTQNAATTPTAATAAESESGPANLSPKNTDHPPIDEGKATVAASGSLSGSAAAGDTSTTANSDVEEEDAEDETDHQKITDISDPLEPFNRAMYHFNDKLYFWVLKPVAQGYSAVVPEVARTSVGNFFANIGFPVRFVNCLLQANFSGAATEFGRFFMNTVWGIGGLLDPAASKKIGLQKQDKDFGQTLGIYGLGTGFYINWPFLGPSSVRDSIGLLGDYALSPVTYLNPWELSTGVNAYDKVNGVSLKIGDYESLKGAAIDPYVAMRNAYVQYRLKKVKERGPMREAPRPKGLVYLRDKEGVPASDNSGLMAGQ